MKKDQLPYKLEELLKVMEKKKISTTIVNICKEFWSKYKIELEKSGDLFYTWQYDIRWAATELRKTGKMKQANESPTGIWELI